MYWILFVMAAIAAIVIALIVGGLATPRDYIVARTTVMPAAPDTVWKAIRELLTDGSLSFTVTTEEAPHRLVADALDDNLQVAGNWTWTLAPEHDGTRVTITSRGSVGNPVVRFIRTFVGHTRSMDKHLRELGISLDVHSLTIDDLKTGD